MLFLILISTEKASIRFFNMHLSNFVDIILLLIYRRIPPPFLFRSSLNDIKKLCIKNWEELPSFVSVIIKISITLPFFIKPPRYCLLRLCYRLHNDFLRTFLQIEGQFFHTDLGAWISQKLTLNWDAVVPNATLVNLRLIISLSFELMPSTH